LKLLVSFFSMFCEKLQNVCPVVANPDKMDKSDTSFGLSTSQHPQIVTNFKYPKILYTGVFINVKTLIMFMLLLEQASEQPMWSVQATWCPQAPLPCC